MVFSWHCVSSGTVRYFNFLSGREGEGGGGRGRGRGREGYCVRMYYV